MKFIYPAIFQKQDNGTFTGYFPDLEGCTAKGDTLEEAVDNANEALMDWISVELEEENHLPAVSDLHDLAITPDQVVRNICITYRFNDGWDE